MKLKTKNLMCDIGIWKFKKRVLPQHTDHAGVMWHGTYFNWLEESRIDSLNKAGIKYAELINKGFEMPVYNAQIKYLIPIKIGDDITIESLFKINNGPRITVDSKFYQKELCHSIATLDLVLINKETFKPIRNRPKFLDIYLRNLCKV